MQLRQQDEELTALGLNVVVVTFEFGAAAQVYVQQTNLSWPMLVDESRALYEAYGMDRGSWWAIYGPQSWWVYAKLLFKGRRLQESHGSFDQLGGDILIDPDGIVRIHHVGAGPADRPSVETILDRIRNETNG